MKESGSTIILAVTCLHSDTQQWVKGYVLEFGVMTHIPMLEEEHNRHFVVFGTREDFYKMYPTAGPFFLWEGCVPQTRWCVVR